MTKVPAFKINLTKFLKVIYRFSFLLYNEWIFSLMASRSKLSASTRTRGHLYLTITIERACAKCFLYFFLDVEKLPFLRYSILTLKMDVFEILVWCNVCQNPTKKVSPLAFEILSLMLTKTLDFFASYSK